MQPSTPSPADLVDALNNTFGKHPGKRASHAKGFCASGEFIPAEGGIALLDSPLFKAGPLTAIVRFSIGGGNPGVSDKSRSVRGLAIRLQGATEKYDLVLVSEPVFFAATPESFVSFLAARVADPVTKKPDPTNWRRTMPLSPTACASRPCWPAMRRPRPTPPRLIFPIMPLYSPTPMASALRRG